MHLNLYDAVSAAGFTTTTLYIKGESSLVVASFLGILGTRKEISNEVENAGIGCRIRTGSPSNRTLVDVDYLIQVLRSCDFTELTWY